MDKQERWYLDNLPLEGAVVADVGANVGRLSQFFWEHGGSDCRVVAIEPQPENVAAIHKRIADAGAENWSVEACAVSSSEGTVKMRAFDVAYGKNSVVVSGSGSGGDRGDIVEVPCRTLHALVPDATIVKLDIEGHEYEMLPEAVARLDKAKAWAIELHMVEGHRLEDTLALLSDNGFTVFAAGAKRDDPKGAWVNAPVPAGLTWDHIPGTKTSVDGVDGVFKMLHIIAKRAT